MDKMWHWLLSSRRKISPINIKTNTTKFTDNSFETIAECRDFIFRCCSASSAGSPAAIWPPVKHGGQNGDDKDLHCWWGWKIVRESINNPHPKYDGSYLLLLFLQIIRFIFAIFANAPYHNLGLKDDGTLCHFFLQMIKIILLLGIFFAKRTVKYQNNCYHYVDNSSLASLLD